MTLCITKDKKKNLILLIDMCRWKVEDEDVEVVHEAIANHHLFFTHGPLWRLWTLQLSPLHRLVQLGVKEGRVTSKGLKHIIHQHLWEGGDSMVADHWFR